MKNNYPSPYVILTVIIFTLGACSTQRIGRSERSPVVLSVMPSPVPKDTVPVIKAPVRKQMTRQQFEEFMDKAYQVNYTKFFAPEFNRLRSIIEDQANANGILSRYMVITRARTDSIANERNYYRNEWLAGQSRQLAYQKEMIKLQKKAIQQSLDNDVANKKQISINTWLASLCMVGFVILSAAVIGIWLRVRIISKKIDRFKSISHV